MRFLQYERLEEKRGIWVKEMGRREREREELWEKGKQVFFDWQLWDTHTHTQHKYRNVVKRAAALVEKFIIFSKGHE